MSDQIEFLIGGGKARVLMSSTMYNERPYWSIAKHKKNEQGWQYGKQTILVGKDSGPEFAQALRDFADIIEAHSAHQ